MRANVLLFAAALATFGCKREKTVPTAKVEERLVKTTSTSCPQVVLDAREGGLDEGRYVVPTAAERHALRDAMATLLGGAKDARARAKERAAQAGFEIVDLPEHDALVLREVPTKKRGGGVYVVRLGSSSRLFVQAPHSFYDEGTLPLACELFARARAGALFVNTAHRYKAAAQTPGGSHPADVAHARDSLFQAATEGLVRVHPKATVVQVHGYAERESGGSVVLSSGMRSPGHPIVARAHAALRRVIDGGVLRFPEDQTELGATTNVQGAIVREAGGTFLHVEIAAPLRRDLLDNPMLRASVLATLADALEGA